MSYIFNKNHSIKILIIYYAAGIVRDTEGVEEENRTDTNSCLHRVYNLMEAF